MFTGIIHCTGLVSDRRPTASGQRLVIDPAGWNCQPAAGDSIAVNGCCLTLAPDAEPGLAFDAIPETLAKTTLGRLQVGDPVHLEHAVTPTTLLGGHLLQGHVDGVAEVAQVEAGEEYRIRIKPPRDLMRFVSPKGSIAVNGVSLTVAALGDDWLEIALIPTTLELTTLGRLAPGHEVNLETDMINKMVVHRLEQIGLEQIGR